MRRSPIRFTIRSLQVAVLGRGDSVRSMPLCRPVQSTGESSRPSVLPSMCFVDAADRFRSAACHGSSEWVYSGFRTRTRVDGVLREPQSRAVFSDDARAAGLVSARDTPRADHPATGLGEHERSIGAGGIRGIVALRLLCGASAFAVGECLRATMKARSPRPQASLLASSCGTAGLADRGPEWIGSGIVFIIELCVQHRFESRPVDERNDR